MSANGSRLLVWLTGTLGTSVAYLSWLGWDQQRDQQPDGSSTGPYQPWQAIGLALTIAAITCVCSWRRASFLGCALITVTLTLCFSSDAATDANADGLWTLGAMALFVCTGYGTGVVATCYEAAAKAYNSRR